MYFIPIPCCELCEIVEDNQQKSTSILIKYGPMRERTFKCLECNNFAQENTGWIQEGNCNIVDWPHPHFCSHIKKISAAEIIWQQINCPTSIRNVKPEITWARETLGKYWYTATLDISEQCMAHLNYWIETGQSETCTIIVYDPPPEYIVTCQNNIWSCTCIYNQNSCNHIIKIQNNSDHNEITMDFTTLSITT